ncbi:MAG: hypothetical protein MJE66_03035 [Proteobacteria bacterium]|nr:hypothetical protein [Pseudomonadota bacterium]
MVQYVDGIIPLLAGIWMTAVGYRYIAPPGRDASDREAWLRRFGGWFRVGGPALILISVLLMALTHFRSQ